MQIKRLILAVIVLMGGWTAWTSSLAAQNDNDDRPVNVGLLDFSAAVQADGVRLDWQTATELNTAGFILQRSSNGSNFSPLNNIGFVPSTGGVATGASYSKVDTTAVTGQTYTYKLVEVETDSSQHDLETVTILFNPQPTATSIVIGSTSPAPRATTTPVPTSTAVPSATPTSTAVSTQISSLPTSATRPTATPQPPAITEDLSPPVIGLEQNTVPENTQPLELMIDQATTAGDASSGVVLAQEELPTAYPGPETSPDAAIGTDSYPSGQELPTVVPPETTDFYPVEAPVQAAPTLAVIGSSDPYPPVTDISAPAPSAEIIRGRILLWAGFLIAFFIFLSGIVGAIVLYRRQPA